MKVYGNNGTIGTLKNEASCREVVGGTVDAVATVAASDLNVFIAARVCVVVVNIHVD